MDDPASSPFSAGPPRCDPGSDLAYQLGRLGEPHRLVEGKHEVAEAFAAITSHRTSGEPYSKRPYWRRVKLRLLSVQICVLFGPIRYMSCASDGRISSATNLFDPPSAAVE